MTFDISGSRQKSKNDKAITYGYEAKRGSNINGFLKYINTHAIVPCMLRDGHRRYKSVSKIFGWVRLDLDVKGELDNVVSIMNKHDMYYIIKPSTNNHIKDWKWHVLIAVSNVAQDVEHYKWQCHNFIEKFGIDIEDLAVTRSVVQNQNPYRDGEFVEEALKKTTIREGKILPLSDIPNGLRGFTEKTKVITWKSLGAGNHHNGVRAAIAEDVSNNKSRSEIEEKINLYVKREFSESQLDDKRDEYFDILDWAIQNVENEVCDTDTLMDMCKSDMDADTIALVLRKAQNAIEREVLTKHIKSCTGFSVKAIKEVYHDSVANDDDDFRKYFNNSELIWEDQLGVFVELTTKNKIKYHRKSNFIQTIMSKSGFMKNSDVNDRLCTIPCKNIKYDPTHINDDDGTINVHRSVTFKKKSTKVPRTIRRVLDNLFIEDIDAKEYFINWMASILQFGIRTGVAWIFYGASGSGKGLIVDVMSRLVGFNNASLNIGDVALQSAFNPYLRNKQFIHLNEIASDFHGRHGVSGKMKAMVTDPVVQINEKGIPEITVENFANIIINSNKPNPIEVESDDRRYNAIVSSRSLVDCSWWRGDYSYQKCIDEVERFGSYLMNYKVDFEKATTPMEVSDAKLSLIHQTSSPLKLLGAGIKRSDSDTILELLGVDEMNQGVSIQDVEESCKTKIWTSSLILQMYGLVTGKEHVPPSYPSMYLMKPYVPNASLITLRINKVRTRCYKLT